MGMMVILDCIMLNFGFCLIFAVLYRNMGLLLVLPALLGVKPAHAEDAQAAKGAAAERRAEFKETAQKIKQTGKDSKAHL